MGRYRIVVRGAVEAAHLPLLDGADVTVTGGVSAIELEVMDQSHLDGVLAMLRDRGAPLVSVQPLDEPVDPTGPGRAGGDGSANSMPERFSVPSANDKA